MLFQVKKKQVRRTKKERKVTNFCPLMVKKPLWVLNLARWSEVSVDWRFPLVGGKFCSFCFRGSEKSWSTCPRPLLERFPLYRGFVVRRFHCNSNSNNHDENNHNLHYNYSLVGHHISPKFLVLKLE